MKHRDEIQVFDIPSPNTEQQERRVLADAVCSPELLGDIIPIIHPDFFTSEDRRQIWETIVTRYNRGEVIDFTLATVVGKPFIDEVLPYTDKAGLSDTPFHAVSLRNGAAQRRAYFAAARFLQETVKPGTSEQDLIASSEAFARAIEGPAPLRVEKKLDEVLDEVKAEIEKTAKAINSGKVTRITTGFYYMDEMLNGGMKSGQLIVLAARPSQGKTTLMMQMAKAAAKGGASVQVFSLEMQAVELGEKLLYSTGQVRPYQVNHGTVDKELYGYAEDMLKPLPLYINDFSRSLDEIVSRITQAVKKGRCNVAYIDYLGLMSDALNFGNAKLYQVIARVTGTLKAVAKRLEIPIVLLCQVNRDCAREDRSPQLYDLRDSGSIEQDADVVLMLQGNLQMPELSLPENNLVVWLRKNRAGKKEVGFVLIPNENFSAFTESEPILPNGDKAPEPPQPVQASFDMNYDNDFPF